MTAYRDMGIDAVRWKAEKDNKTFAKKGTKPLPYPTQPYAITKEEAERRRVEKEKAEYEKMKAKTAAFASMFNASLRGV